MKMQPFRADFNPFPDVRSEALTVFQPGIAGAMVKISIKKNKARTVIIYLPEASFNRLATDWLERQGYLVVAPPEPEKKESTDHV